ncbi:hypothetical protein [Egicoccus sp. AB-alg6-2]|uniref:hypothetical protein n=1 Tax=Egicoccus sp. AB-alg6-2 TaxID=3242692 RepID=UPI00359E66D5
MKNDLAGALERQDGVQVRWRWLALTWFSAFTASGRDRPRGTSQRGPDGGDTSTPLGDPVAPTWVAAFAVSRAYEATPNTMEDDVADAVGLAAGDTEVLRIALKRIDDTAELEPSVRRRAQLLLVRSLTRAQLTG